MRLHASSNLELLEIYTSVKITCLCACLPISLSLSLSLPLPPPPLSLSLTHSLTHTHTHTHTHTAILSNEFQPVSGKKCTHLIPALRSVQTCHSVKVIAAFCFSANEEVKYDQPLEAVICGLSLSLSLFLSLNLPPHIRL